MSVLPLINWMVLFMPLPRTLAKSNKYLANRVLGPVSRYVPGFGQLHHRGRRSGKAYRTPVNVFRDGEEYIVALTYGPDTDWVRNVLAAGECEMVSRGRRLRLVQPRVETDHRKLWAPHVVRFPLKRLGVDKIMRLTPA